MKNSFTYDYFVNVFSNLQKESRNTKHIHYMYYFFSQTSRLEYIFHCNNILSMSKSMWIEYSKTRPLFVIPNNGKAAK